MTTPDSPARAVAVKSTIDEYLARADRPLPGFYWTGETDMHCMAQALGQTLDTAHAHHIQAERARDGVDQLKQLAILGGLCAQATNIQNKSGGPSGPPLGTTPLDAGLTM